jgi:hypothetical protein
VQRRRAWSGKTEDFTGKIARWQSCVLRGIFLKKPFPAKFSQSRAIKCHPSIRHKDFSINILRKKTATR